MKWLVGQALRCESNIAYVVDQYECMLFTVILERFVLYSGGVSASPTFLLNLLYRF